MRVLLIISALAVIPGCDRVRDFIRPGAPQELSLPPPPPARDARPVLAVLENDSVIVEMDDGVQCLGSSGAALSSSGWSGTLGECPYGYFYQVQLAVGTLPTTVFLQPSPPFEPNAPEGEVPFRPLVRLIVTDFLGVQHRFESQDGF